MKAAQFILSVILLTFLSPVQAGGMPLPWPFPWAEDCPVSWTELNGRFTLMNSANNEQIKISVGPATDDGWRIIKVEYLTSSNEVIAMGRKMVNPNTNSLDVILRPQVPGAVPAQAQIRFYYTSTETTGYHCARERLTPVVTIESAFDKASYQLTRVSN